MIEFDRKTWGPAVDELPHYLRHWLDHSSRFPEDHEAFVRLTMLAFTEVLRREDDYQRGEGGKLWTLRKIKDGLRRSCQEEDSMGYNYRNFPDSSFDEAAKMVVLELADMGLLHDKFKMPVLAGSIAEKTKLGLKRLHGVDFQLREYAFLLNSVASMPMHVRR